MENIIKDILLKHSEINWDGDNAKGTKIEGSAFDEVVKEIENLVSTVFDKAYYAALYQSDKTEDKSTDVWRGILKQYEKPKVIVQEPEIVEEKEEEENIPKNLEDCFAELEKNSDQKSLEEWLLRDEEDAVYNIHFGAGMGIRNNWGLWEGENELCKFFHSIGIKHADDMSAIIFFSFHRHKKGNPIKLEEQVKIYWRHWIEFKEGSLLPPNNKNEVSEEYQNIFSNFMKEEFPETPF